MSADFWAGYISGAAGIIIGNPLDLLKTRLQAGDTSVHATSSASLRSTFDKAGTLVRGTFCPIQNIRPCSLTLSQRSNSAYPWLRRPQRPPLLHVQPLAHPPRRTLHPPNQPNQNMERRCHRRPRQLPRQCAHRTDQMPCPGRPRLFGSNHQFPSHCQGNMVPFRSARSLFRRRRD
jgi:hypothetical protein